MDAALIRQSLEDLAERVGDPTPLVYGRLFAARQDLEPLFVGDRTGAARGEMLAQVFDILLDLAEGGTHGRNLIAIERVNHEGLGVPPALFTAFFPVVAETVRDGLAEAWTPDHHRAWQALIAAAVA